MSRLKPTANSRFSAARCQTTVIVAPGPPSERPLLAMKRTALRTRERSLLTKLGLRSWKSVCPGATADRGPTLRSQLNRSSLKQINQDALNTTSPDTNALIY